MTPQKERQFHQDLDALRDELLLMGELAQEMVSEASKIAVERDPAPMHHVRELESRVNKLHLSTDESALRLIALHQPAARDLRLIAACLKVNNDLERVGDQAVNIAETSCALSRMPEMDLGDIPRMARLAGEMLADALNSFAAGDSELAGSVIARDDEEDALKSQTFNELVQIMRADASKVQRAMDQILISRNLERIADHATNIAEDVIFMVKGTDIRHPSVNPEAPGEPPTARRRLLFVCFHNSCRSQMAEGFAREAGGEDAEVWSAGSRPSGKVNPTAVEVMREAGIDIQGQRSKGLHELPKGPWDVIVTMGCGDDCPEIPARSRVDWEFPDPTGKSIESFREVRDGIRERVQELSENLDTSASR